MCDINPQIHCVVENENGTYRVERYNNATHQYEIVHNNLSKESADEIKKELDADLQG